MEESLTHQVVRTFVAKINSHRTADMDHLLTNDHRFVTSQGVVIQGRAAVREAWQTYFSSIPEYAIHCEQLIAEGSTVAMFGYVCGTTPNEDDFEAGRRREVPAAWKVVVHGMRIAEWHEYVNSAGANLVLR